MPRSYRDDKLSTRAAQERHLEPTLALVRDRAMVRRFAQRNYHERGTRHQYRHCVDHWVVCEQDLSGRHRHLGQHGRSAEARTSE